MIIRKFTRIILGAALGISVFAFAGNVPETAYAANMSDISVTSTREDVQQVVDDGNFDYTELDGTEIDHIYELYNNHQTAPASIRLQRHRRYSYAECQIYPLFHVRWLQSHQGHRRIRVERRQHQLEKG